MMMSGANLKSYSDISYHNEELKSLTLYRFNKIKERAKLKSSVSKLVNILFPELKTLVPQLHMPSIYALLSEFPSASHVASAHLTRFTDLLSIEAEIKRIMNVEINSPILTIPGISYRMGAMIIAEIGDFNRFDSADRILAYAGMSLSTYQSGQLDNCYAHIEKRGSR